MSKAAVNNTAETRMIALADLRVAEWNARKTIDLETLAGLTESLKLHGVQVPLIVRPRPGAEGYTQADSDAGDLSAKLYEIIAGHRRFKAAAILKLAKLPCIVRELDDVAAREIGLVDNLQREDVPAMEEAEAFGELLDRLLSIAAVAARVGKEQGYVAKRLKLRTCTEHTRRALSEQLITVDHALLLARLGEDEQNAALKWTLDHSAGQKKPVDKVITEIVERRRDRAEKFATDPDSYGYYRHHDFEPQSIVGLKAHIADESGTPLARAPWALDDANLMPDVGACAECPQNTKANAPLFGDLDMAEPTCTDGGCFKAKTEAFVLHGIETAKKSAPLPILRVSWKATSTPPRLDKETGVPTLAQVFKQGQWDEATKKCEHQRAAVTVDWKEPGNGGWGPKRGGNELRKPGEIVQVCIEPKCKVHLKDWAKPKSARAAAEDRNGNSADGRAKREQLEAAVKAENQIRANLVTAAIAGVGSLSKDLLRAVVLLILPAWLPEEDKQRFPGLKKSLETSPVDSVLFARAAASLFFVAETDETYFLNDWANDVTEGRKELLKLLRTMGWKGSDPWAKPAPPKAAAKKAAAKPVKKTPAKKIAAKKAAKKGGGR